MSVKLTEKQLELLLNAVKLRINELHEITKPLLVELAEHENLLSQYGKNQLTANLKHQSMQPFEVLPWSRKIIQVLAEIGKPMTTNEIVANIVNRIPALAEESSTRSSVASILSRRSGKLFKKVNDKYGLIDW